MTLRKSSGLKRESAVFRSVSLPWQVAHSRSYTTRPRSASPTALTGSAREAGPCERTKATIAPIAELSSGPPRSVP